MLDERTKRILIFVMLGGLWLAIGVWGYRQERMMVDLVERTTKPVEPEHWVDAKRTLASDPDSPRWGLDLTNCQLPLEKLVHGGPGLDGVPALTQPHYIPAAQAFFLKPESQVIGVTLDGQSRAWPLSILQYHEIINDTLAEHSLLVTWHPLSGTAMVFFGKIGGQRHVFGNSGLFYLSAPLIYDRQSVPYAQSLWSPLLMRAVSGPAMGEGLRLELVDADLMSWDGWVRLHPETTVLSMNTGFSKSYNQSSEGSYESNDYLMMPVGERSGRRPDLKNKDEVLIVQAGESFKAYPIVDFRAREGGRLTDEMAGHRLELAWDAASGRVSVQAEDEPDLPLARAYSYWFAWDAYHPAGAVYEDASGASAAPGEEVNPGSARPR